MSSKTSRAERRRLERQRKRILNIAIIGGVGLIVAGFFLYLSSRPIELVVPEDRSFPVPVDGLTVGDPNAPVLVEAFEDFQCPSCLRFTEDIEPLLFQNYIYTGEARFTFRHNPFIGVESMNAANAAMCASEQGMFWEYHDIIFANQLGENIGAYTEARLRAMAEEIGLDVGAWQDCYDSEEYQGVIDADLAESRSRGVTGTPTVFVNGVMLQSFDYQSIAIAIEQAAP